MWIFLRDGFASVRAVGEQKLMVRFRRRQHAEKFSARLGSEQSEIFESDETDYRYRIMASRAAVAKLLAEEAMTIDYDNFKNACGPGEYHDLLSGIWSKHWHYQESEGCDVADAQ